MLTVFTQRQTFVYCITNPEKYKIKDYNSEYAENVQKPVSGCRILQPDAGNSYFTEPLQHEYHPVHIPIVS